MRTRTGYCRTLSKVLVALAWLPAALHAQFAYVANSGCGLVPANISGYTIDSTTGALTPISGSPFPAGISPNRVAVDPSGRFAYVPDGGSDGVLAYTINSTTGALTPISGSPFSGGSEPISVAVDPSGKFVYVANFLSSDIWAYTIDSISGALTPIPGSPFPGGFEPVSMAVDPSGRFAYVTNWISADVLGYTIDATTGALTLIPGSPFPAGVSPISLAVAPGGKFAFVVNIQNPIIQSGNVSGYTIDSTTGALTPIPGSPFPAGLDANSIAVDPSGKFAYVTNGGSGPFPSTGSVSAYAIDPTTGALTPISGSPFLAGSFPDSVAVEPSGKFAYVTNGGGMCPLPGSVSAYTIDSETGALTPIAGSPFSAGIGSRSVTVTGCAAPPKITDVSATPATLWPPNHKLVEVLVDYEVTAACGELASCTLSVASNEPVNNDHTSPDWVVLDEHHVKLRAERSGKGTGRLYTIKIGCQDTRGNSATQNTAATVPHDQGN